MKIKHDRKQEKESKYVGYENPKLSLENNEIILREIFSYADSDGIIDIRTITLTPQDILKLMTWLVGQKKHEEENTMDAVLQKT